MGLTSQDGARRNAPSGLEAANPDTEGLASPDGWVSAPLTFLAAAQTVAAAVEERWPQATAIVARREPTGMVAICRGDEVDLGPIDIGRGSELLNSVAALVEPRRGFRARKTGRTPSAGALSFPFAVGGELVGVLFVFGLPGQVGAATHGLLGSFASLLGTIQHLEMHGERIAQDAEAFRREARTDPVTGVLNRRGFLDELEAHCAHASEDDRRDLILLADVRGLKDADNHFGYAVGDHLLCQLAETLVTPIRAPDIVGRVGHDQFAVILCGDHPAARAVAYTGEVRRELARRADGGPGHLALQFGARTLAGVKTAEQALRRAAGAGSSAPRETPPTPID